MEAAFEPASSSGSPHLLDQCGNGVVDSDRPGCCGIHWAAVARDAQSSAANAEDALRLEIAPPGKVSRDGVVW
jgi:hypothetical protein